MKEDTEGQGTATDEPWFAKGLRFTCTGCGKCCTGPAGSVSLSQPDIERLAKFFEVPIGKFVRKYVKRVNDRRVLVDKPGSSDCVFLDGKACAVYQARPTQCRTYPWWLTNIQDQESWAEAARLCEGIDHPSAPIVPAAEILEQVRIDAENDSDGLPWGSLVTHAASRRGNRNKRS